MLERMIQGVIPIGPMGPPIVVDTEEPEGIYVGSGKPREEAASTALRKYG